MTDTSRLDALEIRITHQDAVIDDLNKMITAQWKEIDRLTREILVEHVLLHLRVTQRLAESVVESTAEDQPGAGRRRPEVRRVRRGG